MSKFKISQIQFQAAPTPEENASQLSGKLTYFGTPVHLTEIYLEGQPFYRVRVGPVYNVESADTLIQQLIKAGYTDSHLVSGER